MKKKFFVFLALLSFIGIQAFGEQVSEQQALQIAVSFMNQKVAKSPSFHRGKTVRADEMMVSHIIKSRTGEANLYILNAGEGGKGFVIVSGETLTDDAVPGYSDTGWFD